MLSVKKKKKKDLHKIGDLLPYESYQFIYSLPNVLEA